jgi:serine/threonine protein kinase
MGSVWLARRSDGQFDGRAAIKLLNLDLLARAGRARLQREGSLLARLTHPGIARLLDAGVSAIGQPYLVLEYVDGVPIDVFVAERKFNIAQRLRLFLQVLEAVAHAHDNLVVHLDLKPSNILVTPNGAVKLLDFGIAKLLDADGVADRSVLGTECDCALTPEYAAPEQARGDPVTTATDVYTLGALLYLLVCGRRFGTTADALGLSYEVEPDQLGLGDLEIILAKALRRDAAARYHSAAAFAADLRRYLRHEPISARRGTLPYRAGKLLRRHRIAAIAAGVTALALVAPIGYSLHELREARRQRDAAQGALERQTHVDAAVAPARAATAPRTDFTAMMQRGGAD